MATMIMGLAGHCIRDKNKIIDNFVLQVSNIRPKTKETQQAVANVLKYLLIFSS